MTVIFQSERFGSIVYKSLQIEDVGRHKVVYLQTHETRNRFLWRLPSPSLTVRIHIHLKYLFYLRICTLDFISPVMLVSKVASILFASNVTGSLATCYRFCRYLLSPASPGEPVHHFLFHSETQTGSCEKLQSRLQIDFSSAKDRLCSMGLNF